MPPPRVRILLASRSERAAGVAVLCRAVDARGLPAAPWIGYRRRATVEDDAAPQWAAAGRRRALDDGPDGSIAVETVTWALAGKQWRQRQVTLDGPRDAAARLVGCARGLIETAPLRLVGLEAADVAAWRLAERRPDAIRVATEGLQDAGTAADAFRLVGQAALRQALANRELVAIAPTPEAIHQLRVGLRRLRAALQLFADCLDEPSRRAMGVALKGIDRTFAPARDWDVFIAETAMPAAAAVVAAGDLDGAMDAARAERMSAYAAIAPALFDPRINGDLLTLVEWLELGGAPCDGTRAEQPVCRFARRVLRRSRRRLLRHFDDGPPQSTEEWHRLRILAKKLRYATDAFAPLYERAATQSFRRALQEVQDRLGRYNDAAVADRLAARLDQPAAAGIVAGWTAHERVEQTRRFSRAWKKLRKCRPFWQQD